MTAVRGNPAHGTRACYLQGCQRPECVAGHSAYGSNRNRQIAYGRWQPWADAAPVRAHIEALVACGMTRQSVAKAIGSHPNTIRDIMRRPTNRVRREFAEKILAIPLTGAALPPKSQIGSAGTVRRLQALIACGWPAAVLAGRLGKTREDLTRMMDRPRVQWRTAQAVKELYSDLWDVPPPSATARQRAASRQASARAAAAGWPPPAAWDDDQIDLPDGRPARGWQRAAGQREAGAA